MEVLLCLFVFILFLIILEAFNQGQWKAATSGVVGGLGVCYLFGQIVGLSSKKRNCWYCFRKCLHIRSPQQSMLYNIGCLFITRILKLKERGEGKKKGGRERKLTLLLECSHLMFQITLLKSALLKQDTRACFWVLTPSIPSKYAFIFLDSLPKWLFFNDFSSWILGDCVKVEHTSTSWWRTS